MKEVTTSEFRAGYSEILKKAQKEGGVILSSRLGRFKIEPVPLRNLHNVSKCGEKR